MGNLILNALIFEFGTLTIGCAVFGVYSFPMGFFLKDRKQSILGFWCLVGAFVGAFTSMMLIMARLGYTC